MSTTKPHPPHKNPSAHPVPAPAAAPAPAPQAPAYVPLKWSYPFTSSADKDGNDTHSYFEALSNAEDGFYPLGANGIWHGGIHFGRETGHILKQENGVRAIADGEVVAYRLDSAYPVLKYEDGKSCIYSTGFVLVRHRLQLPPAPAGGSGGAQAPSGASSAASPASAHAAQPPADETLTFFSLYMHTLDWRGHNAAIDASPAGNAPNAAEPSPIKCMPYWKGERRYRVRTGATDAQREPAKFDFSFPDSLPSDGPDDCSSLPGISGAASPLKWLEPMQFPTGTSWPQRFRLIDQQPLVAPKPKGPPAKGAQVYSKVNGEAIGLLPQGSEVQLGPVSAKDKGWAQITTVLKGEPVGAVIGDPIDPRLSTGWVKVQQFDLLIDPTPLDSVVVLDTPYPVAAGTVVGYLGEYQRYREASKLPPTPQRQLVHLEVFAGPDLPAFIKKSQARAKQWPDKNAFVEISAGAMLVDVAEAKQSVDSGLVLKPIAGAGEGPWVKVQPTLIKMPTAPQRPLGHGHAAHPKHPKAKPEETSVGSPVWVERGMAGQPVPAGFKAWSDFPLQVSNMKSPTAGFDEVYSRGELDKFGAEAKARDDKQAHWWKITVGTSDGNSREGWVCDTGHKLVQSRSAWEWPGFELIDNTSVSLVDSFKRFLYDYNLLFDGDKDSFEPSAISVNSSALISRLEKVVDRLGNSDGKVSASELARAQSTRWVAQAMSHLAVRYESEWGGDLSKWKSMSSLMKEREFIWRGELARIEKLRWWDKVHGVQGSPADPAVYHFHPVGVVGNFADLCPQQCKTDVYTYTTSEGDFVISTRSFELILASEGYKDHPYVPPNDQSSGVTVGYGYDLGQQSSATITNDLQGLFADATISRLTRASGVHGDAARAMAPSFGDIYVSRDAALQLAMRMKRRFAQQTVDAFPGVTRLHPHCQGALLSLIVNRGPGLQDKPHQLTRKHMRAIRKDVSSGNLQDVVAQFRDMKSLWNPAAQRGLLIRRDKEADLFEDGANCTCWR